MVNWDLGQQESDVSVQQKSTMRNRVTPAKKRKTLSRPLVEPEYNSHLLHAGRRSRTINKNGKKIRIRRVVKQSKPIKTSQPNFSIE